MSQVLTNGESTNESLTTNVEQAVRQRYSAASKEAEPALCCPVDYNTNYLEVLPQEIIDRDYGCGDPSKYVKPGETVLDLGSGGGKICYIASQVVGAEGSVIGVDMNDDMLELAHEYKQQIGDEIGHHNVDFRKGRIQDLALNLTLFEDYLAEHPIASSTDWLRAQEHAEELRQTKPLVESDSIDVIVSNCVLNLVKQSDREQLFSEMFRVLRRGGRVVISDIVSDETVPEELQKDPALWSGCISGAFEEKKFFEAFENAGFYGARLVARQQEPWATVDGIEFRSVTIEAYKGKEGPCMDHLQAVVYKGPWKSVTDDDGHVLRRGVRTAVCKKTFEIYNREPYVNETIPIEPHNEVTDAEVEEFDCRRNVEREAREQKGTKYNSTVLPVADSCCGPDCC